MARVVISEYDLSWVAGFFDGEGCVGTSTVRRPSGIYYYPNVQIGQKLPKVLYWFVELWGGSVNEDSKKTSETGPRHVNWRWTVTTAECRAFLTDIQPFVRCKREQVNFVLSRPKKSITEEEKKILSELKKVDSWPE